MKMVSNGIIQTVNDDDREVIRQMKLGGWVEVEPEPTAAEPETTKTAGKPGDSK